MSLLSKLSKSGKVPLDISVLHIVDEKGTYPASMSLLEKGGGACYGLQKLCQRFAMLLLTEKGSMKFMPERGCNFIKMVQNAQNESYVRSAFTLACVDLKKQLVEEENDSMRDSERFSSAELTDVSFWFDTISISIRLYSRDGNSSDVILPVYTV